MVIMTTSTLPVSEPFKEEEEEEATAEDQVKQEASTVPGQEEEIALDDSKNSSIKMSHNHIHTQHKNGDICWVAVLRNSVVLVETMATAGDSSSKEKGEENKQEGGTSSALDVAIGELLGQPVNLGWQFYSPWQGEYKGIKFHVYDDSDSIVQDQTTKETSSDSGGSDADSNAADDDEKVITVWTFGCIYYSGSGTAEQGGSTTSVLHRPRVQAFLEKIMLLTEPLRLADETWRHGEHYACQELYSDMLAKQSLVSGEGGGGMMDLDYSRTLTEVNRQVVNRHNQYRAEKEEMKRCQELALLQQMQELNQSLEKEQYDVNKSSSKKWWQSSSSLSASASSGGLFAAASRQIFSSSSNAESQSQAASQSSINSSSESIATIESGAGHQHQQDDDMAPSSSKFQQQQTQQQKGMLLYKPHPYDDDDVNSVESINALSDVSSVCVDVEDILSQLEREVTFRTVQAHVAQHTAVQQPVQEEVATMRSHHRHAEEEKKEMDQSDDDVDWNEPQSDSSSKSLHSQHHGEPPKSPSSTMTVVSEE